MAAGEMKLRPDWARSLDATRFVMALRDLRSPYLTGTEDITDDYRDE